VSPGDSVFVVPPYPDATDEWARVAFDARVGSEPTVTLSLQEVATSSQSAVDFYRGASPERERADRAAAALR
jgi:hypothetical protein